MLNLVTKDIILFIQMMITHIYIFDDDWNKVKDDEYETIKYAFELFKIRLDVD